MCEVEQLRAQQGSVEICQRPQSQASGAFRRLRWRNAQRLQICKGQVVRGDDSSGEGESPEDDCFGIR